MWQYQKNLQFPINIKKPNPQAAKIIITQYGGTDGKKIYALYSMIFDLKVSIYCGY